MLKYNQDRSDFSRNDSETRRTKNGIEDGACDIDASAFDQTVVTKHVIISVLSKVRSYIAR